MEHFYLTKFLEEQYDDEKTDIVPIYGLIPEGETQIEVYNKPFVNTFGTAEEAGRDLRARLPKKEYAFFTWKSKPFDTAAIRGEEITLEDVTQEEFDEFINAFLNRKQ